MPQIPSKDLPNKPPPTVKRPIPATPEKAVEVFDGTEVTPPQPDFNLKLSPVFPHSRPEMDSFLKACEVRWNNLGRFSIWLFEHLKEGLHYGTIEGKSKSGGTFKTKPFLFLAGAEAIIEITGVKARTVPVNVADSPQWEPFISKGYVIMGTEITFPSGDIFIHLSARHPREEGTLAKAIQMAAKGSLVACVKRAFSLSQFFVMEPEKVLDDKVWQQESGQIPDSRYAGDPGVIEPPVKDLQATPGPAMPRPDQYQQPSAQTPYPWSPADSLSRTIADRTREIANRRGIPWDFQYMFACVQQAGTYKDKKKDPPELVRPPGDPNQIRNDRWKQIIVRRLNEICLRLREEAQDKMMGFTNEPETEEEIQARHRQQTQAQARRAQSEPEPPSDYQQPDEENPL